MTTATKTATPATDTGLSDGFLVEMLVDTDVIGGTVFDTKYATELLVVDLDGEPQDGDLVVRKFVGSGRPHLARFRRTGRDQDGRFVPAGDPREAVDLGVISITKEDFDLVRVLGRVIGPDREFPRVMPSIYKDLAAVREESAA